MRQTENEQKNSIITEKKQNLEKKQNKISLVWMFAQTFSTKADQNAAVIIPVAYSIFSEVFNVIMGLVLWKLGWARVPACASCGEYLAAYGNRVQADDRASASPSAGQTGGEAGSFTVLVFVDLSSSPLLLGHFRR